MTLGRSLHFSGPGFLCLLTFKNGDDTISFPFLTGPLIDQNDPEDAEEADTADHYALCLCRHAADRLFCPAGIVHHPDAGRDWGQEEKGTTEDEMAGWHH